MGGGWIPPPILPPLKLPSYHYASFIDSLLKKIMHLFISILIPHLISFNLSLSSVLL